MKRLFDLRQAANWFVRRREPDLSVDERARFLEWRRADSERDRTYSEIEATWAALGALAEDEAIRDFLAEPAPVRRPKARRAGWSVAAMTATAAVVAIAPSETVYATGIGEQRTVSLADGSMITIDADSRLRVRETSKGRVVRVERGEAYFDLSRRNSLSPLSIRVRRVHLGGDAAVFDVRAVTNVAMLDVIQGQVRIEDGDEAARAFVFVAGQQARIHGDGHVVASGPAEIRRVIEWRAGRVYFDDSPLQSAVAEMNRYSRTRLELGKGLDGIRIGGLFRMDGARDFALALKINNGLHVEDKGEVIRISSAGL